MKNLDSEMAFRTSRSSGAGGQHVNKTSTRVELLFNVWQSQLLEQREKELISKKLKNRISQEGILSIAAQNSRSQLKNREYAIKRFYTLLADALKVPKRRKPTKVPRGVKEKILKQKKRQGEKKQWRGRINPDNY